ncbi:MAG: 1-acyl-sn-glycerol-3-phosphate acyltransferase, partial [Burkholderiales bacterium]|nr:1-acyl-sn-glycerol-3-phosphate acyltransferase [Burkholderiales bacterium]
MVPILLADMGAVFYSACRTACQFVRVQCIRQQVHGAEGVPASGPALLAVTHISHLEPIVVSTQLGRQVRWMARQEFYQPTWARFLLDNGGAFPVDRFGWSLPAVRTAARLLDDGQVVGVFPEGGVAQGALSVLRGARLKQGVCTISFATQVPIIPVVVLGTHELNHVAPWLPFRRARLWTRFGAPVAPLPRGTQRRAAREAQAKHLEAAFRETYMSLRQMHNLSDSIV